VIFMIENPSNEQTNTEEERQISSSEGSTASKTLIYQRLHGFNKNSPNYNREEHLALSSKGGKHRKPSCQALRRLLSKQQKKFAGDAKCSYREAYSFYHLLLSFDAYKRFAQHQLFELLVLMKNDVDEELRMSTVRNPDGSVKYIATPGRRRVIEMKIREFELLMKAAKIFHPEARDSFTLNFVKSDVPLDSPLLRLVAQRPAAESSNPTEPRERLDLLPVVFQPENHHPPLAAPIGETESQIQLAPPAQPAPLPRGVAGGDEKKNSKVI